MHVTGIICFEGIMANEEAITFLSKCILDDTSIKFNSLLHMQFWPALSESELLTLMKETPDFKSELTCELKKCVTTVKKKEWNSKPHVI